MKINLTFETTEEYRGALVEVVAAALEALVDREWTEYPSDKVRLDNVLRNALNTVCRAHGMEEPCKEVKR